MKFLINLFNLEKYVKIGEALKIKSNSLDKELATLQGELNSIDSFLSSTEIPEKIGEGAGWLSDKIKGGTDWLKDKLQPETPGSLFPEAGKDVSITEYGPPEVRTSITPFGPGPGVGMTRGSHLAQIAHDVSALLGCVCGISGGFIGGGGIGVTGGIFESQSQVQYDRLDKNTNKSHNRNFLTSLLKKHPNDGYV